MLGKTRWLTLTLVVALVTVGLGGSADADSGAENSMLSAINSTRSSAGLGSLKMDGGLQAHARRHTADMIAAGDIYHSSSGELQAAAGSGWSKLGENVGRGGSVSSLHKAFLKSAAHKANIHGDYNYVGIGAASSDGVLYVTVVFMKKGSTTTTTTAPPTTTTTTAAAPAATPTTPAATPTTTPPSKSGGSTSKQSVTKPSADDSIPAGTTTTTTTPPTTTTTLVVPPDKPVTPGESCFAVTRFWWMCHD